MLRMLVRRILLVIPILVGLSMLLFAVSRLLPGDPVRLAAGPQATAERIEQLREEFGLDRPLVVQYVNYVLDLSRGDFGESVMSRRPVAQDIAAFLPATIELVVAALVIAVGIGVPLGLLAAVYKGGLIDNLARFIGLIGLSTPQFFLGLILQLFLALSLNLFPLSGRYPFIELPPRHVTGFLVVDSLLALDLHALGTALAYLALPAITLSLTPLATIMNMMRNSTIEVLHQDYVRTARAYGLSATKVNFKYVLKNAFTATLTVIGLYFGWLLGGTVVVETVFDWPGIGLYATKAIVSQDFQPVIGVALVVGLMFVVTNIFIDVCYRLLNPKVGVE